MFQLKDSNFFFEKIEKTVLAFKFQKVSHSLSTNSSKSTRNCVVYSKKEQRGLFHLISLQVKGVGNYMLSLTS